MKQCHNSESALFPLICHCFIRSTYTLQSAEDLSSYGIDWNGPTPPSLWHGELDDERTPIEVPAVPERLQPEGLQVLAETVDAMGDSDYHGVDLYIQTLNYILNLP